MAVLTQRCIFILLGTFQFVIATNSDSYRILMIPIPAKSHMYSLISIAKELVFRGHKVHFLLRDDFKSSEILDADNEHITFVRYRARYPESLPGSSFDDMADNYLRTCFEKEKNHVEMLKVFLLLMELECRELLLNSEDVIRALENVKFDIALVDGNFVTQCKYLLPLRLGIPWITYADFVEQWLIPVPWLTSFVPSVFTTYTDQMNFGERFTNTLIEIFLLNMFPISQGMNVLIDICRQYGDFDSLKSLMKRSKLFISSQHHVLDYAKPSMPNLIEAAGLTTRPPKDLPNDIQEFLDGSKFGAILVTFGSSGSTIPRIITERFTEVFSRLEGYRVILKFENLDNLTISENVRFQRWLPQQDILGHSKTRLFITHCGNNGQYEAVYHAVPMIGLPLHADEPYNAMRMQHKGYGIMMNIHEFSAEELFSNIVKILNDPGYKRRVSLASEAFRNDPQRPAQKAAHWIEHVIRFGSEHLESGGKELNFFQYYLLDMLAVFMLLGIGLLVLIWKIVSLLFRTLLKLFRSKKVKTN